MSFFVTMQAVTDLMKEIAERRKEKSEPEEEKQPTPGCHCDEEEPECKNQSEQK